MMKRILQIVLLTFCAATVQVYAQTSNCPDVEGGTITDGGNPEMEYSEPSSDWGITGSEDSVGFVTEYIFTDPNDIVTNASNLGNGDFQATGERILKIDADGVVTPEDEMWEKGMEVNVLAFTYRLSEFKSIIAALFPQDPGCCGTYASFFNYEMCDSIDAYGLSDTANVTGLEQILFFAQQFSVNNDEDVSVEYLMEAIDSALNPFGPFIPCISNAADFPLCYSTSNQLNLTVSCAMIDAIETDEECHYEDGATVEIYLEDGTEYTWAGGASEALSGGDTVLVFSSLPDSTYTFTIENGPNCSDSVDVVISTPDEELVITSILIGHPSPQTTGIIEVDVTGGVEAYSYLWIAPSGDTLANAPSLNLLTEVGTYSLTLTDANGCVLDTAFHAGIAPPPPTSIQDVPSVFSSVAIYPNPVKETLSVELEIKSTTDITINIYDVLGAKSVSEVISNTNNVSAAYDMSALSPGIYNVEIITAEGASIKRQVLKK